MFIFLTNYSHLRMKSKMDSVDTWTCEDVEFWLEEIGLDKYAELLTKTHKIDGQVLMHLTEKDLREPPLQMTVLGDIKRLALFIQELRSFSSQTVPCVSRKKGSSNILEGKSKEKKQSPTSPQRHRVTPVQDSTESEDVDSSSYSFSLQKKPTKNIPLELWKTLLSFVYVFGVFMVTAFVMVVVHDRVPEMDKYPPLPDLFLDNMPYVPWAFDACELVGLVLGTMWFTLLLFHKHRFVAFIFLLH